MPVVNIDAEYVACVRSDLVITPVCWAGPRDNLTDRIYRAVFRFSLSDLPAGATVNSAGVQSNITARNSASALYNVGAYGGDGSGDPETDSAAIAYARSDMSSGAYLSSITDYQTVGSKTLSALGAVANSDIEALIGGTFTLAISQVGEDTTWTEITIDNSTDLPTLIVDYSEGGSGTIKSVSDSGIGSDDSLLSVGVGVLDSGVGIDTPPVSALQQVIETAAAIDNIPGISTLITLTDSAIGTDQNTASASMSAAESATGSDGLALSVQLVAADLGSGSDAANVLTQLLKVVADLGSGTDGTTVGVNVSALDTAAVTDLPTVSVNLATADLGSGLDAVVLITETMKSVIDTGSAIDQVNVQSLVATSDTGSGSDNPALLVNLSIADSGSGLEVLSKLEQFLLSVSDAGAGLDSLGLTVNLNPTDSGAGIDQIYHQTLVSTLETAGASDVVIRYIDGDTVIASISFTLNSRSMTGTVTSRKTDINLN